MKKRFVQLGGILGIVAVLGVLCIGVERVRGRRAINARLAELKARGERLAVGELEPRRPPAEQNAVLALLALANEISQLHPNVNAMPPAGRFAAPGRMMTVWQFETWAEDKRTNDWPRLVQTMDESSNVIQGILTALQKPEWDAGCDCRHGFTAIRVPPLVHLKQAALILSTAAACDLRLGRTNAALEHTEALVRLVGLQRDEPWIISQLVRNACAALVWNATWGLIQANAWSDAQLARLQAAWTGVDLSASMARAMEMERAMTLDHFRLCASSAAILKAQFDVMKRAEALLGGEGSFSEFSEMISDWVHLPLWRMAWADQDALRALNRWQELIDTDRIARTESWAAVRDRAAGLDAAAAGGPWAGVSDKAPQQNLYDRWRYLFSSDTSMLPGRMVRRSVEHETSCRWLGEAGRCAPGRHAVRFAPACVPDRGGRTPERPGPATHRGAFWLASGAGRRMLWVVDPLRMNTTLLGIEIGGSKLQMVLGDGLGRIHRRWRRVIASGLGGEGIRAQIKELLPEILAAGRPGAIAAGFGGPVDGRTGRICCSHQVPGWSQFDLGPWLSEQSGLPAAVENDSNAATLAEAVRGAGAGCDPVFYFNMGSGVGGGLVAGGVLYHGATPGEAEFGHLRLDRDGTTVEARCSGWAVDRRIRALCASAPDAPLARLAGAVPGGESQHLAAALAAGDPAAERLLRELAGDLGFALSHAVHLFHPSVIVMGGGLSLVGEPLRAAVAAALPGYVMEAFHPAPPVRLAGLGEDAVPVGALLVAAGLLKRA